MYMSYCRFEGTRHELRACMADVEEHVNEEAEYEVSNHEIREFRYMIEEIANFLYEQDLLDEYVEVNHKQLDKVCEAMAKRYGEGEY